MRQNKTKHQNKTISLWIAFRCLFSLVAQGAVEVTGSTCGIQASSKNYLDTDAHDTKALRSPGQSCQAGTAGALASPKMRERIMKDLCHIEYAVWVRFVSYTYVLNLPLTYRNHSSVKFIC